MGKPTDELRARLNELDVEYDTYDLPNGEHGVSWIDGNDIEWEAVQRGENFEIHALQLVTPEQAIAATVGKRRSIPSMSKMEGVVCKFLRKIAPDRDWMYLGEVEHAWIAELVNTIATDMVGAVYGIRFAPTFDFPPETMVGETVFDSEGNAIGWIVDATVGKDIEHYDGGGRRGTVAILQGGRKPEEVLFVRDEGGVTHYLPEDVVTCKRVYHPNRITKTCTCSNCGYGASDERWAYCPKCGHKYVHGEVEERWKRAGRKVAE